MNVFRKHVQYITTKVCAGPVLIIRALRQESGREYNHLYCSFVARCFLMLRNRTLLAVSLVVCAAYTGIGMIGPVRVLYAQSRGASLAIIGTMSSAYLISNFLFQYPSGWLADRFGRKPIMLISLFAQAALSLAYLFISDPILFVVLRFAEGIAAAAVGPSARALVADSVSPEH